MAVVAAPYVVAAAGFGAGGVAVGTVAAKAMGLAWTTGWGVGTVATLQSVGAVAGLTVAQSVAVGTVVGAATTAASSSMKGVCSVPDLSQCLLMYIYTCLPACLFVCLYLSSVLSLIDCSWT